MHVLSAWVSYITFFIHNKNTYDDKKIKISYAIYNIELSAICDPRNVKTYEI
jgi:hypothetical protein